LGGGVMVMGGDWGGLMDGGETQNKVNKKSHSIKTKVCHLATLAILYTPRPYNI
jgi:hypothetical protein